MARKLTAAQRGALLVVAGREPRPTTTSSRNWPGSCIAGGSARRLAALGLIEVKITTDSRTWYGLTEAGRDLVATMVPAHA